MANLINKSNFFEMLKYFCSFTYVLCLRILKSLQITFLKYFSYAACGVCDNMPCRYCLQKFLQTTPYYHHHLFLQSLRHFALRMLTITSYLSNNNNILRIRPIHILPQSILSQDSTIDKMLS